MKMLIYGKWVERKETIDVLNPFNGSLIDTVPKATKKDMLDAITSAEEGYKTCRNLPIYQRSDILRKTAHLIKENKEMLANIIAQESSKTIHEARKEANRAYETILLSAEEAKRLCGQTIPFEAAASSQSRTGYYLREPVGIIGAITPYNDPLNLVCHKVGPAIAGGNAIIVKPSMQTPLSALKLAELFLEAGLPKNILSVITGSGKEIGEILVQSDRVRMISFTGGVKTGEHITKLAGLKKLSMELGSNSPVIVMEDCEFDLAVSATVSGAFYAVGQNCIGVQRIYVQRPLYERFKTALIEASKGYKIGSQLDENTDMGPMINLEEAKRVIDWVKEAQDKGAKLLLGGKHEGTLVQPTLLDNVPTSAKLAYDEIFGPVALLAPFDTLEEAVGKANAVDFGLHAAIFTQNLNNAFYAIHYLDVGSVIINDSTDYRIDMMPFGGRKKSGLGREGVRFTLEEMTEPKVVCFNLESATATYCGF